MRLKWRQYSTTDKVTLGEGAEFLVGVEGACGAVAEKLRLDGELDHMGRGASLRDSVGKVIGDGAEQPGADNAVHPYPGRRSRCDVVGEDMAFQGVLDEDVEERLLPPPVEGGVDIEEEQDQRTDVLDRYSLLRRTEASC